VSVTDNHAVVLDTISNILTNLLLTSDLRGTIENPAAYFTNDKPFELDRLMMTQGWRRYDVAAVVQGRLEHPSTALELGPVISGKVKRLLINRAAEKAQVSIVSGNGMYFDLVETDGDGRFSFNIAEQPDSTVYIVQAVSKSGYRNLELLLDNETFPERTPQTFTSVEIEPESFQKYVEQTMRKEDNEDRWELTLPEFTVTGRYIPKSVFRATYVINEEEIREASIYRKSLFPVLEEKIHGIKVDLYNDKIYYPYNPSATSAKRSTPHFHKLIIDDQVNKPIEYTNDVYRDEILYDEVFRGLYHINPDYVTNVYLSEVFSRNPTTNLPQITDLIVICQDVNKIFYHDNLLHIKTILPLGFQQPVAFYAPIYDTPEAREQAMFDLRTDNRGTATFEFYTADSENTYTVLIEGITTNGKIIRHEEKLWIPEEKVLATEKL
jgi:hypothetical protein